MGFFDTLPKADQSASAVPPPKDADFFDGLPGLYQFLTATEYSPGNPREKSGLTLRCEDGCFKLWLSDPTAECGIEATGESVKDALAALELRITSAAPGWKKKAQPKRRK